MALPEVRSHLALTMATIILLYVPVYITLFVLNRGSNCPRKQLRVPVGCTITRVNTVEIESACDAWDMKYVLLRQVRRVCM